MNPLKYLLPLAAFAACVSCEKEIDFEYHDIPAQLVIEGLLTQEGASVRLTETAPTDEHFTGTAVTDATVTVRDLTDGLTYTLAPDADGNFTAPSLLGSTGHSYGLTVIRGADTYTSLSGMHGLSEIVSAEFNWIRMPYDDVAVLKVQFKAIPAPEAEYWLRVYRNDEIYEWQAIEPRNAVDGLITGMLMTSRKDVDEEDEDDVLREGDIVGIEVLTIPKAMADYLNSLNNGDYNGNRMFDGPYCLGYFLAAPISRTQITYNPDQIPHAD